MKYDANRLQRVLSLAASEERRECLEMGRSQRALDDERHRADELKAYRRSYAERPAPAGSVNAMQWLDYQKFLRRLDQAVELQSRVVVETERSVDAHRARWQAKRQRVESLERIVERHEEAAKRHDDRLRQKAIDDIASRGPAGPRL